MGLPEFAGFVVLQAGFFYAGMQLGGRHVRDLILETGRFTYRGLEYEVTVVGSDQETVEKALAEIKASQDAFFRKRNDAYFERRAKDQSPGGYYG